MAQRVWAADEWERRQHDLPPTTPALVKQLTDSAVTAANGLVVRGP